MSRNSIDTTASDVATNALQAIPFGSVIGAPLKACIEAQSQAAKSSWDFIREVGMTTDDDGNKKAVYVSFEYRKDGRNVVLSLPLLTIVPIPYITVKDINIAFKASISAAASSSTTKKSSLAVDTSMKTSAAFNMGVASAKAEFSVGVSSKKDSSATRDSKYSVEYTMDISVQAGQDDMPAGMLKVLELLGSSIDAVDRGGDLQVSARQLALQDGNPNALYATYKNTEGYYAPDAIKVADNDGHVVATDVCKLTVDDPGVVCMFYQTGSYWILAGEKKLGVNVI